MTGGAGDLGLLRLFQLVSPALPVGGFHYSDGLETAVALGWVDDEESAASWIGGRLAGPVATTDLPILARMVRALAADDRRACERAAALFRATRDSREARAAAYQQGAALVRLLEDLGVSGAAGWRDAPLLSLPVGFALAACAWQLDEAAILTGYAWTFCDGQVAAAVKLVPLGQTAGQRLLVGLGARIPDLVAAARLLGDDEIGSCAPGAGLVSAWHEDEAVRLYRS